MRIVPTGDRLLIRVLKQEASTGGIFLPQKVQMTGSVGEIIATGPGYLSGEKNSDGSEKWEPTTHRVGQKILFFSKTGIIINDKFRLLHDKDVLALISSDDSGVEIGDAFSD